MNGTYLRRVAGGGSLRTSRGSVTECERVAGIERVAWIGSLGRVVWSGSLKAGLPGLWKPIVGIGSIRGSRLERVAESEFLQVAGRWEWVAGSGSLGVGCVGMELLGVDSWEWI